MTHTITFRPDRVYEVTGIWPKPGQGEALKAYFGEVFPIAAQDYGVKPLFSLEPLRTHAGDFAPPIMFVNEWPSIERFRAFTQDARARALFPRRDAAVSRLVVSHYTVPAEKEATLADGDVVEFAAMWIREGRGEDLRSYYQRVFPVAVEHGLRPITPLEVVDSYKGDFTPSRAGLNLWGTLDRFDAFADAVRPQFAARDAALSRLEVTHAAVRFGAEL